MSWKKTRYFCRPLRNKKTARVAALDNSEQLPVTDFTTAMTIGGQRFIKSRGKESRAVE